MVYLQFVQKLSELMDDLESTASAYVTTIQRDFIRSRIRSLPASSLESIANSGIDDRDQSISGIALAHLIALRSAEPPKTPEAAPEVALAIVSSDTTPDKGSYFDLPTTPSPSATDDDTSSAAILTPTTTAAPLDVQERFATIVERSKETHGNILKMSSPIDQLAKRRIITEIKQADAARDHAYLGFIDNDITKILGTIVGAPGTDFEGGIFFVVFNIPKKYPISPPKCRLLTKVYSMHVDIRGEICLDILGSQWSPVWSLCDLMVAFMSILSSPNPDDPSVPEIASLYKSNKRMYHENVRRYAQTYATGEWPSEETLGISK